jgi:hypothetical protein
MPTGKRNAVDELDFAINEFLLFLKKYIEHIYRLFSLSWNVTRRKLDGEISTSIVLIEPTSDVAGDLISFVFIELLHQRRNGVSLGLHGACNIG